MTSPRLLAPLVQSFFSQRLVQERNASSHTIAAYRDTFRLLLKFAHKRLKKTPAEITIDKLTAGLIVAFLRHLEDERGNTARTRNHRLAAIRSFFRYLAFEEPAHAGSIQQVLAIPQKRESKRLIVHLEADEVRSLLDAASAGGTGGGQRDHLLLQMAVQTGLRVSELIALRWKDVVFGPSAYVNCLGKGRKERTTPLSRPLARAFRIWRDSRNARPDELVFSNARGSALSRDGVRYIVRKHLAPASRVCASLKGKRVSPHVLRHTTAVRLLNSGVDRAVIALWLGHESVETTQMYLAANLATKEAALAKSGPLPIARARFRPPDSLLSFLEGL